MSERKASPLFQFIVDVGPLIFFFAAYFALRERTFVVWEVEYSGFIAVTAVFVPLVLIVSLLNWKVTGRLSRMQIMTAVLVTVFGGLSVWLNDERFFKIKPTIIYLLFAGTLGFGLMRKKSYLQYMLEHASPMTPEGYMILTRRSAYMCLAMAVANEFVWRMFSTDTWVTFKTFGLTGLLIGFFLVNGYLLRHHYLPR
ncbi:MAG: septation protein IspZ [Rhodobacteraceae bacterium]|nr:septation protein IspZ [Paracoccaceae bacterium]